MCKPRGTALLIPQELEKRCENCEFSESRPIIFGGEVDYNILKKGLDLNVCKNENSPHYGEMLIGNEAHDCHEYFPAEN